MFKYSKRFDGFLNMHTLMSAPVCLEVMRTKLRYIIRLRANKKKTIILLQEFTRSKNKIIHIFSSFRCGASRVHSFGHIRTDLGLKKTEGRVFPSKMDRRKLLTVRDTSRFLKIYTWSKLRETLNNVRNILRTTFLKSDSLNVKYLIISNANQETSVKENKRKR